MTVTSATTLANLADGIKKAAVNGSSKTSKKPHLLFAAAPVDGHTLPLIRIAGLLIDRGFRVTFIAGEQFEAQLKAIGAKHVPIAPMFNPEMVVERNAIPAGVPRLLYDLKYIFIGQTPSRWQLVKDLLVKTKTEDPSSDVVIVQESFFMGVNPLSLGAPLPECVAVRPKVVNLHVVPYMASSVDTGPLGPGLPPDSSESGRMRNELLNQMMIMGPFAEPIAQQIALLKELGATQELAAEMPFHHWMAIHDVTLQMCPPSLEYPRSDHLPNVKFAGCLAPKPVPEDFAYPEWWADVTRADRRVVTVTQGTVATVYTDLLIPAIEALADREDMLVVAILGHRGVALPSAVAIPPNTRVIDYIPYDAILPHTSVFVMNAGYGGFLQGMTNGVPMVLAGETEDKKDIAMHGEWAGVAVNLRTGRPEREAIRSGVERAMSEPGLRKRVLEIRRENEAMDTIGIVEGEIMGGREVEGISIR